MQNVLALIPARGGSKGIPGKNVREIAGRPLIGWTIQAALASRHKLKIVCSTDDDEIASVARNQGAEVPFRRPPELATDDATSLDVALHALDQFEVPFTHLLLLQPTSPLRTAQDIDGALDLAFQTGVAAVVATTQARSHPYLTYFQGEQGELLPFCRPENVSLRRQDLPSALVLNGAIYVNLVESLRTDRTFFPANARAYEMPRDRSIDIDDWDDWREAENLLLARRA